jgi:signal peptidase II
VSQQTNDYGTGRPAPSLRLPAPPARHSERAGLYDWVALLVIVAATFGVDQLTKSVATRTLERGESRQLLPFFSLTRIQNDGIAFSQFGGQSLLISIATTVAIVWMLVYFTRSGRKHAVVPSALGLVIGGASANLVDRLGDGKVTDFLQIHHWPIFNVADMSIVCGVALLIVALSRQDAHRSDVRRS